MVCSSSPFRGAAASSDDVRRGVHSLALALGSVRLVWRGLTLLDFRFVLMFIIETKTRKVGCPYTPPWPLIRYIPMRTPPIYRPTTMARFSSLVAIAAVATVTLDALVPGADAARLGTWMMSSEFCPPRRACAAPLPPWHTALPVIERLGVVGRGVWAGWRAGGRECHDCCTVALLT